MEDIYRTLQEPSSGLFKDRGSRFLSFAYPVENLDQIREILGSLRKEYHDARHHCYAYRLGPGDTNYRVNDDGEPNNSAGKPILGQIQSYQLTNVLIVVIRYFGGTLLGVGGLIQAYKTAAKEAVENGTIIEKYFQARLTIEFLYPEMNEVLKILKDHKADITRREFGEKCLITASVRQGVEKLVTDLLRNIENTQVQAVEL
jgi:uncharacterized YigZ family protein